MKNKSTLVRFLNAVLNRSNSDPIKEVKETIEVHSKSKSAPTSPIVSNNTNYLAETSDAPQRPRASTDIPIQNIEVVSEDDPSSEGGKNIRYDIVCVTKSGMYINVEMQKSSQKYCYHRALYYTARLICRQGYKGEDPSKAEHARLFDDSTKKQKLEWAYKLAPTYHISILDFD